METGLQKLNHQQKAVQWGERIASCRSSGRTVRQWCSENGISAGSYYKWQRRLYQMTAGDGPQFIEVTPHQPARNPAAVIHIRDTEVEILPGIDVNTAWIRGELYSMHQFFTQYLQKLKNMVQ